MVTAEEKKKILIIDDDETHLPIAQSMLMSEYEVITVKSGKEALDHLRNGYRPKIILLDVAMPAMDGWDTYNRIKEISTLYVIPIVFLTSKPEKGPMYNTSRIGTPDYILKPYIKEELLFRVKTIIENSENKGRG